MFFIFNNGFKGVRLYNRQVLAIIHGVQKMKACWKMNVFENGNK
jgi:hypothetical protein